jgi:hypothetical protein
MLVAAMGRKGSELNSLRSKDMVEKIGAQTMTNTRYKD